MTIANYCLCLLPFSRTRENVRATVKLGSNPPNYEFVMELMDTEWDEVSDDDRADIVSLWSREMKKWGHYYEPTIQEDGTIVLRSHVRSDIDLFFLRNQLRYGYVSMHFVQEEPGNNGREYEMRFSDEHKRL